MGLIASSFDYLQASLLILLFNCGEFTLTSLIFIFKYDLNLGYISETLISVIFANSGRSGLTVWTDSFNWQ